MGKTARRSTGSYQEAPCDPAMAIVAVASLSGGPVPPGTFSFDHFPTPEYCVENVLNMDRNSSVPLFEITSLLKPLLAPGRYPTSVAILRMPGKITEFPAVVAGLRLEIREHGSRSIQMRRKQCFQVVFEGEKQRLQPCERRVA